MAPPRRRPRPHLSFREFAELTLGRKTNDVIRNSLSATAVVVVTIIAVIANVVTITTADSNTITITIRTRIPGKWSTLGRISLTKSVKNLITNEVEITIRKWVLSHANLYNKINRTKLNKSKPFSFVSLNVDGMIEHRKMQSIDQWAHEQNIEIVAIQKTREFFIKA